jgi:dynein heavy chain
MLMSNLSDLDTKPTLVSLWIHETFRVFRDRLVDANDREKYSILDHDKLEAYLSMDWKLKEFENLLFGDYESSNRSYVRLSEVN